MLQLKDFVREALVEIAQGVEEARQALSGSAAEVNPSVARRFDAKSTNYGDSSSGKPIFLIEFDVAVTATEGTQTKGGIGVVAGVLALGSQGQSELANSSVSRIKFMVPMALPYEQWKA
jgi:alpha-D-ribose 1-methylphosphonate 5-triphosphate diphosphatase PhnM